MKKRMLYISNLFPNPYNPNMAAFNKQMLLSLTDYYVIDAVVPIPWINRFKRRNGDIQLNNNSINLFYPTYYYIPLILRILYGHFFYYSIKNLVNQLIQKNNYDIIYSSWLYPDAWAASKFAKKARLPHFITVLGTDVNRLKKGGYLANLSLNAADSANKVICVSKALRNKFYDLGYTTDNLIVLENGVDTNIFAPRDKNAIREKLGIDNDAKLVLFVGRLTKDKGLYELSIAFANIVKKWKPSNLILAVIGQGKYESNMKKLLLLNHVLSNTLFLGSRSLDDISLWMNACDVLCLPSYMEGQPNVLIEAIACKTKIVATNVGGIPELDCGSGNIMLVPPKSINELEKAVLIMLNEDIDYSKVPEIKTWNEHAQCLNNIFTAI